MSQTSGSLTIDTSSLAAAIVKGFTPALAAIENAVSQLSAASVPPLTQDEMADAFHLHGTDGNWAVNLAAALTESGYSLVMPTKVDLTGGNQDQAESLAREGDWFDRSGD